jgi:glycerol-3-phosphate O-acyltransferase
MLLAALGAALVVQSDRQAQQIQALAAAVAAAMEVHQAEVVGAALAALLMQLYPLLQLLIHMQSDQAAAPGQLEQMAMLVERVALA